MVNGSWYATKCGAEWVCGADQNGNNLRIIGAYLQISDYCSVTARVRAGFGLGLGLVRVRIKVSIRVRVADCCIQTAGEIDKTRICHVIKLTNCNLIRRPLRILSCPLSAAARDS